MADITFLSAPIGGGKSLFATRAICLELERTDRYIVTNVPVYLTDEDFPRDKKGEFVEGKHLTLGEWCHEYVKEPIEVRSRVRILTEAEMKAFFRYLPQGQEMPLLTKEDIGKPYLRTKREPDRVVMREDVFDRNDNWIQMPNLQWRADLMNEQKIPFGTFFLLDEVHNYFNARKWQDVGGGVEKYMSQLRKYNDDIYLITQHPEKVDKNFRRNATEWIYLKNFSRQRLFMGVALEGRFRFQSYATQPQRGDTPQSEGWMQLEDRQYQKCYNTMAGAGLKGLTAPEKSRFKGRHWTIWIVVIGILLVVGVFVLPRFLGWTTGTLFKTVTGGFRHQVQGMITGQEKLHGVTVTNQPEMVNNNNPVQTDVVKIESHLNRPSYSSPRWERDIIVDWVELEGKIMTIGLSDGEIYHFGDGHFTEWQSGIATVDGVKYRFLKDTERNVWEQRERMKEARQINRRASGLPQE